MPIDFIPDKKIDFTPDGPATATIDFVPDKPLVPLDMSELGWSAEGPGPQSVNVGPRTESMQPVDRGGFTGDRSTESLIKRYGKQIYNSFAKIGQNIISSPFSPIGVSEKQSQPYMEQARTELESMGLTLSPVDFEMSARKRASELAAAEKIQRYKVEPAKTAGEKVTDVAGGLTAFLTQLALTKKILPPGTSEPLVWEIQNQLAGGFPGEGVAMASTLGAIGKIPAVSIGGKVAKVGAQSGAFATISALSGGDTEDVIIAALVPVAFQAYRAGRGKISDINMVKQWRGKLPFTRDIPMKESLRYAQAMRSAFDVGKTKDFNLQGKKYKQWHKRYGVAVEDFLNKASDAFQKTIPKQIGTGDVSQQPPVKDFGKYPLGRPRQAPEKAQFAKTIPEGVPVAPAAKPKQAKEKEYGKLPEPLAEGAKNRRREILQARLKRGESIGGSKLLGEFQSEQWAKDAIAKLEPSEEGKEIKHEEKKEAVTEPKPSIEEQQRKTRPSVSLEPTGTLDPTKPKDATEIIAEARRFQRGKDTPFALAGIYETEIDSKTRETIITKVIYSHEQVDQAYRTLQTEIDSPQDDVSLFAMPGKEKELGAIGAKMARMKALSQKKRQPPTVGKVKQLPTAKLKKEDYIKAVNVATEKGEGKRYAIHGLLVEGNNLVATDGRRMLIAQGKWGKDGLYLNTNKGILGKAEKTEKKFPKWQDIIPTYEKIDAVKLNKDDMAVLWRRLHQAATMVSVESQGVAIILNKDGTLGVAASAPEVGHTEINVKPGGKILGAINPRSIMDALSLHAVRGDKIINFYFPFPDRVVFTTSLDGKTRTLTMPVNLGEQVEPTIEVPSQQGGKGEAAGFVAVPAALKDIAEITEAAVSPAESRFARLGLTGKKLVARAKKAHEQAKIRAGRSVELMHRTTKGLTSVEKKNLGYAVNYIAWEKDVRAKREKLRGYKLRAKPSSLKQSKAASTFLKLADYARSEYEKLGGEVKMGGIPWPQRFTKEGLKLYAEAMDAVDKNGNPNFKILRENALIKAMIEEGTAKDVGQAYKTLKRQQDWIKRPLYAYMERNKEPLPSKYLEFDVDKIVDQDFWLKMYRHVEYARQFGVEHYRAAQYIKAIKDEHGEAIANSVQEWWDRLIDLPKQETKGQIVSRKLAFALGQYQALKLSPLTSIQNFFQRWLSAMEWGPIAVLRGQAKAWTRKGRIYARESGAIPFDPFEAGLMADLKTKESRAFARAWVETIGMGVTERGNNYTAALTAARGITNDLEKLSKKTGPIGSLFKNLLSLGGDSKGAIKRRLQKHGVNWKKALKRGHLTIDELHLVSLREAESKHFRTDFFTTPTWWQKSPWGRQWAKYKIPFAYNMMIKIWKLSAIEAAHGNFRPMLAFLLVTTLTGEIYNLWRKFLLGEDRSDLPIVKRLWEDIIDGGAIGLFGGLVFGKDIVEKIWNTTFGVSGATLKRTVELVGRKIPEAPEHTGEHLLRHIEQEIPTVKYINQATWQKEDHIRRFNRYKVREYEEELVKREGDLWYYYEDLYDAAIEGDRAKMVNAARKAIEHGATLDTLITAMTSRRPAKTAQVKRPKLITGLAEPQKEVLRKLEREHDIAVARVRVLAKGRWNEYVAGLIRQASSKKRPLGERQRAMQRLNNIGVSKSQWDKYLREARK